MIRRSFSVLYFNLKTVFSFVGKETQVTLFFFWSETNPVPSYFPYWDTHSRLMKIFGEKKSPISSAISYSVRSFCSSDDLAVLSVLR